MEEIDGLIVREEEDVVNRDLFGVVGSELLLMDFYDLCDIMF